MELLKTKNLKKRLKNWESPVDIPSSGTIHRGIPGKEAVFREEEPPRMKALATRKH